MYRVCQCGWKGARGPVIPSPAAMRTRSRQLVSTVLLAAAGLLLLGGCLSRSEAFDAVISITEPKAGTARSTEQVDVYGYAMDDNGIAAIRVDGENLFNSAAFASEQGKKLVHFGFRGQARGEGELNYVIEVEDVDGNVTTLNYTLTVDVTPPSLELTATSVGGGAFNLSGTARDNVSVSAIRIGGVPYTFAPGPEVSFDLPNVTPSERIIEVTDSAGNTITREF